MFLIVSTAMVSCMKHGICGSLKLELQTFGLHFQQLILNAGSSFW